MQNNHHSSYYYQMRAANYFGIYHKDSHGVNLGSIYFDYGDMNVIIFAKLEWDKNTPIFTLDHHTNLHPNCGLQHNNFNCGFEI